MKATRKLIPAIAMLLVALITTSTASYAWFSMNKQVSATGMTLTATAPANLLISADNDVAGDDDATWAATEAVNFTTTGKLYPASTTNGKDFYAIGMGNVINGDAGGILADGNIANLKFIPGTVGAIAAAADGYYAEYTLEFKTTGNGALNVYLSSIDVTAVGSDTLDQCVRVAILDGDTLLGIYAVDQTEAVNHVASVGSLVAVPVVDDAIPAGYYTKSAAGVLTPASGNAAADVTYYSLVNVVGSVLAAATSLTGYYTLDTGVYTPATGSADGTTTYYSIASLVATSALTVGTSSVVGYYTLSSGAAVAATDVAVDGTTYYSYATATLNGHDDMTAQGTNTAIFAVAADEVVKTITVRVWIEGQNSNCVNALGLQAFNIGLTFKVA